MLEGKLTNNRIRWYERVLRMNEERISKKILNIKVKNKTLTREKKQMEKRAVRQPTKSRNVLGRRSQTKYNINNTVNDV
jgi:hypothetical protein